MRKKKGIKQKKVKDFFQVHNFLLICKNTAVKESVSYLFIMLILFYCTMHNVISYIERLSHGFINILYKITTYL